MDALSFSDNCLLVRVLPGSAPGRPARVELVPDVPILTVRNLAGTTSSARRHAVNVFRAPDSDEILIAGNVYRHAKPVEAWVTVPDPQYFERMNDWLRTRVVLGMPGPRVVTE